MTHTNKISKIRYIAGIGAIAAGVALASLPGCGDNLPREEFEEHRSEVSAKTVEFQSSVNTITGDLEEDVSELQTRVPKDVASEGYVDEQIEVLSEKTAEFQSDFSAKTAIIESRVEDYEGKVEKLEGRATVVEGRVGDLEGRAEEYDRIIADIQTDMDTLNEGFQDYKKEDGAQSTEIGEGLRALTKSFDNYLTGDRLQSKADIAAIQTDIDGLVEDFNEYRQEDREQNRVSTADFQIRIAGVADKIDEMRDQSPFISQSGFVSPYRARDIFEALDASRYSVGKDFVRDMYWEDSSRFLNALRTGFPKWWDGYTSNGELDSQTALLVDEPNRKSRFYFMDRAPTTTTITPQTVENALQRFLDANPHRVRDVTIHTPGGFFYR